MAKTKYIETPEKMWEYFIAYKQEIKDNPFFLCEQRKGNINIKISANSEGNINFKPPSDIVELPLQRPLTMEGFENWLFVNDIITDVSDYFENKDNRYSDYIPICRAIKRMIRQDQIEGGMCGIYNPSITQRLNSLTEKTDITTNGKELPATNVLNLPTDKLQQLEQILSDAGSSEKD